MVACGSWAYQHSRGWASTAYFPQQASRWLRSLYPKQKQTMVSLIGQRSVMFIEIIYTIILIKSVCRFSQTAGRNSCSIVSGNVSNCSYRLTIYRVTRMNTASPTRVVNWIEPVTPVTAFMVHRHRPAGTAMNWAATTFVVTVDRQRAVGTATTWTATTAVKTATTRVYTFTAWKCG